MDSWPPAIANLVDRVRAWALSHPKVKGLAVVGSWARGRARPDSDIDLLILTDEVTPFLTDPSWVELFGTVRQTEVETWGHVRSIRAWYRDGREVEFAWAPLDWASVPLEPGSERVIRNGLILLYDPLGLLADALRSIEGPVAKGA